jgi:hypothetical protein
MDQGPWLVVRSSRRTRSPGPRAGTTISLVAAGPFNTSKQAYDVAQLLQVETRRPHHIRPYTPRDCRLPGPKSRGPRRSVG